MKVIRLDDSGTKTPSGKLPDESRKKKRNPPAVRWSGTSEESGENAGGKGAENAAPAQRSPTYSEIMEKYLAGQYADALAGNRRTAEAEADAAERDAQDALERIRGGYKNTDRQLYREYMESTRTLPQRLAAQGITGGLTESSQVRLANSYGEELAENGRARLAEEAKAYSARDARLAAAKSERERADAEAKKTHSESLAKLWQEEEKRRREEAAKAAALLAAAGDYSGYVGMGLTQEQADYLTEIWMGRNNKVARCAARGTARQSPLLRDRRLPTRSPGRFFSTQSAARTPPWSISPRGSLPAPSGATKRRRSGSCSAPRKRRTFNF